MRALPDFTTSDYLALGLFACAWIGFTLFADHSRWRRNSVSALMAGYRLRWMRQMLRRENRMVDVSVVGSLQNGAAFFASSTILALGGLMAVLSAEDAAAAILQALPFVQPSPPGMWQTKVLLLIAVLAYAFFKFAWSFRLHNYVAVLLGAAPLEPGDDPEAETHARRAARIGTLAARHFNRGLRAYFFALAALAWFLHPWLFAAMTVYVLYVLHRREFRSKALAALKGEADDLAG
ncbi:MAG: DUF599 domain-containing protein [Kiloniellales bacterium]